MDQLLPLISIAMPVLNSEKTIAEAISSTILQSYPTWELLLLDDGSSDNTISVARRFADPRIRIFVDGEHKGLAARLNEAVRHAQGTYIARMDADDVMYPDRLRLQVNYLTAHPGTDLLGGSMLVFKGEGEAYALRRARTTHEQICGSFPSGMSLSHPTWMGKRSWFERHPYDCTMTRTEDRELLLRANRVSRYAALPEIVLGYREDSAVLAKKLPGRLALARGYLSYARRERQIIYGVLGAAGEYAKAAKDVMMVGTGLGRALSRQHSTEISQAILEEWSDVWLGTHRHIKEVIKCAD